jgi:hypothetical protein
VFHDYEEHLLPVVAALPDEPEQSYSFQCEMNMGQEDGYFSTCSIDFYEQQSLLPKSSPYPQCFFQK